VAIYFTAGRAQPCAPSARCACDSQAAASKAWHGHRTARHVAASVDSGQLEQALLEEAQTSSLQLADAVKGLVDAGCGQIPPACRVVANATRRPCRLARVANFSQIALQRLEEASAAVLFGDDEDTVQSLANAILPAVLRRHSWVAAELDRCGRRCERALRGQEQQRQQLRGRGRRRSIGAPDGGLPASTVVHSEHSFNSKGLEVS